MKRNLRRALGAAGLAAALVMGSTVAASANPTPGSGLIGGGDTVTVPEPAGITFTTVSAGTFHSLGLGSDGNLYAWGSNVSGQLGDGTNTDRDAPVLVPAPDGVRFVKISAGGSHSVALDESGKAYAWGWNEQGQLGVGDNTDRNVPTLIPGVTFAQISVGAHHSLALDTSGKAYAWGWNLLGQLGVGDNTDRTAPTLIPGATFSQVSTGGHHTLALDADGNVFAWGSSRYNQLGIGLRTDYNTPTQIPGFTFAQVSAGGYHSLARAADGTTFAWGMNGEHGETGLGLDIDVVETPTQLTGANFSRLSSGGYHSSALDANGSVFTWGSNENGQLGVGDDANRNAPVQIPGAAFDQISSGGHHSLAIDANGDTFAWGINVAGQLGTADTDDRKVPTPVVMPDVAITGVAFDGIAGTGLVDNGDGTWSVLNPPHEAGPVDVVVSWTLGGIAQTPITYAGGFTYTLPVAPTISDPSDRVVAAGDEATFAVTVTGNPAPTVAWEVSTGSDVAWEPIATDAAATPSADGLSLSVVSDDAHDGFRYRATATNSAGDATSAAATLTVTSVRAVLGISDPADQSVESGDEATFQVAVTGDPTPTVAWEVAAGSDAAWQPIAEDAAAAPSEDGLTLTVVTEDAHDGFRYRAVATNSTGMATSGAAMLAVTPATVVPVVAPAISDPADQSVAAGEDATFEVEVTGDPTPSVAWEVSVSRGGAGESAGADAWKAIDTDAAASLSEDGLTLTVVTEDAHDGFRYRAVATNSTGMATSGAAMLAVTPATVVPVVAPAISDPADQSVAAGEDATFEVEVTGDPTPSVAWEVSVSRGGAGESAGADAWKAIDTDAAASLSEDGLTLTVAADEAHDGAQYRAVATNSVGEATSAAAQLTVEKAAPTEVVVAPVAKGSEVKTTLARTGAPAPVFLNVALAALVIGGGLIAGNRLLTRRPTR